MFSVFLLISASIWLLNALSKNYTSDIEYPLLYADFPDFGRTFLPDGRAPRAGECFSCPDQAETLKSIAASRGESFYRGDLAKRMVACAAANGGALTLEDLANHEAEGGDPSAIDYESAVDDRLDYRSRSQGAGRIWDCCAT